MRHKTKRIVKKLKRVIKRIRWAPTPKLKPGTYTAAQVLTFVKGLIAEEPKRLEMHHWLTFWRGRRVVDKEETLTKAAGPVCGTVACVGGWINTVVRGKDVVKHFTGNSAIEALNLRHWSPEGHALNDLFSEIDFTPDHVIQALDQIIATHRPALDAAKVRIRS